MVVVVVVVVRARAAFGNVLWTSGPGGAVRGTI